MSDTAFAGSTINRASDVHCIRRWPKEIITAIRQKIELWLKRESVCQERAIMQQLKSSGANSNIGTNTGRIRNRMLPFVVLYLKEPLFGCRKFLNRQTYFKNNGFFFWILKNYPYLCCGSRIWPDGPGRFPVNDKAMKASFDKLVYMGVKMVLDCTPVGMAVAVLAQTNKLTPAEAVKLKAAIIDQLR